MASVLYGYDGRMKYELDKELKSGGEGIVYTIKGKPHSVAKIYKKERISDPQLHEATKNKILAMLDMHFDPKLNGRVVVAWPEDCLFDSSGFFAGFVMPKIENMKSLIWASRPSDRAILWPNGYRWHYSVAIAFNLALTIEHIHKAGIIVGDMNTNNILIDEKGNVTLIDADSFNVTTKTGQEYKCIVGFPEVLPAELQGKDLTKPTSQFSERTDTFSLAVHVFNLLCNNCHPFGCLNYSTAHGSSSNPKIQDNIIKGYCPYVSGSTGQTVDDALDMDIFPDELRRLFDRAFRYSAATAVTQATIANRPSAKEWRVALGNLYNTGVRTCQNPLHEFPKTYHGGCPWCAVEQRKAASASKTSASGVRPWPALSNGSVHQTSTLQNQNNYYGTRTTQYTTSTNNIPQQGKNNNSSSNRVSVGSNYGSGTIDNTSRNKTIGIIVTIVIIILVIIGIKSAKPTDPDNGIKFKNQAVSSTSEVIDIYSDLFDRNSPEGLSITFNGIYQDPDDETDQESLIYTFTGTIDGMIVIDGKFNKNEGEWETNGIMIVDDAPSGGSGHIKMFSRLCDTITYRFYGTRKNSVSESIEKELDSFDISVNGGINSWERFLFSQGIQRTIPLGGTFKQTHAYLAPFIDGDGNKTIYYYVGIN